MAKRTVIERHSSDEKAAQGLDYYRAHYPKTTFNAYREGGCGVWLICQE